MDRLTDEVLHVMRVLYEMRDKVTENPDLFLPGALDTIDKEITRYEGLVHVQESA